MAASYEEVLGIARRSHRLHGRAWPEPLGHRPAGRSERRWRTAIDPNDPRFSPDNYDTSYDPATVADCHDWWMPSWLLVPLGMPPQPMPLAVWPVRPYTVDPVTGEIRR
jgi:hypothetical protein